MSRRSTKEKVKACIATMGVHTNEMFMRLVVHCEDWWWSLVSDGDEKQVKSGRMQIMVRNLGAIRG